MEKRMQEVPLSPDEIWGMAAGSSASRKIRRPDRRLHQPFPSPQTPGFPGAAPTVETAGQTAIHLQAKLCSEARRLACSFSKDGCRKRQVRQR
jgi:hypothetical protein